LAALRRELEANRVSRWPADVRGVDLGEETFDLILASQLLHHFDSDEVSSIVGRAARALRRNGRLVVVELVRVEPSTRRTARRGEQMSSLLGLYFALTSRSGLWTVGELSGFLAAAGLDVSRPRSLRTAPGVAVLTGRRRG
jgi:hypothetical protein